MTAKEVPIFLPIFFLIYRPPFFDVFPIKLTLSAFKRHFPTVHNILSLGPKNKKKIADPTRIA